MTEQIKKELTGWVHAHREYGINLLQQLVQQDSTQGNEQDAQRLVADILRGMDLEVDIWEPGGEELSRHPDFISARENFKGSLNVVGVLKGQGGGRSVILNGHIDVVPAGDREQWANHPFSGAIIGGRMYGRGVTDMKGGNVALLLAMEALQESGIRLKGDVIFQSVIEEESGGAGTLAAILRGYRADAAIIPEPTNLKIFPKQQGSMWFRIHVRGRSAHGGTRYEGVSAIEKSMLVVEHLRKLEEMRNKQITDPLYENALIPVPINIGKIEGGDWPSSVPDLVKLEGRMGVSPEETIDEAQTEMTRWLAQLAAIDPWFKTHPPRLEWFGARWLPGSIPLGHGLMNSLCANFRDLIGTDPVIEASPWGTDGGLLTTAGGIPAVVFGPGTTEMAHFPDEYIELDHVFKAAEVIACTLVDWCGVAQTNKAGRKSDDPENAIH
ncbi:peptidase [Planococcus lenghuensis]|uniref:Acetylornithine deacetylase n=1 Tax=Planococcus lenghuensis TaxID=2213202 RepID=A0A1Q2KVY4_9BACL|nr:peptidase [Planococcus lenghuensis]AQQ52360.1 acetylornithine deacetylase [Planococcus lenghuensis]